VKCPKCSYLGFETGDRCRNCGYDFSLMTDPGPERVDIDLDLRDPAVAALGSQDWLAQVDNTLSQVEPAAPAVDPAPDMERAVLAPPDPAPPPMPVRASGVPKEPTLPLFLPSFDEGHDEPLIRLPAAPRPPLAVRRTPETPRLRPLPQAMRRPEPEPALAFDDDDGNTPESQVTEAIRRPASRVWADPERRTHSTAAASAEVSSAGARATAAALDHLLLCGIDLTVLYFTLRMAGLSMSEWTLLPPVPFLAFLLLVKLSYFCAFTAVGGQTIGKMAARIRVVGADDRPIDGALAMKRALAGTVSAALLGLGFLPALVGSDRRALHDRLARTRVIALPSA